MRTFITGLGVVAVLGGIALVAPSRAHADAAVIHYLYDPLDRLVGVVDQHGNVATYTYDAVGNVRRIERVDAAATPGAVGITLVTPNQGVVDTVVRIFGKGFSAVPDQNAVRFNGTPAVVTSAAPNHLVTRVPPGATTGPITVQAPLGFAASPTSFRVIGVLAITPPGAVLLVGGSRAFTASDSGNPDTSFSWSVNGIAGGNADVGTVTTAGVYTAPASVPAPATVTLTATTSDDPPTAVSVPILVVSEPPVALELSPPLSVGVAAATTDASASTMAAAAPVAVTLTAAPPVPEATPAAGFARPVAVQVTAPAVEPGTGPALSVAAPVSVHVPPSPTGPGPATAMGFALPVAVGITASPDPAATTPVTTPSWPVAVGLTVSADPAATVPVTTPAGPIAVAVAAAAMGSGHAAQGYALVAVAVAPVVASVMPASASPGTTDLVVTLTGTGLADATAVTFLGAGGADGAMTVTDVAADPDGTRVTIRLSVASHAVAGPRVVGVTTSTGRTSAPITAGGNVFTVQ